jgi:hypothetical protein
MLATARETLHRLRQEDNCSSSEETQRAVGPTAAQDPADDADESDPDSEVWEDAEDTEVDKEQLTDLGQCQPEVGDPPLPISTT